MLNVKELSLDLGKRTSNQHVIIAQGDTNGTTIEATIYDHGTKLADTGLTAYFVMLLPDGEHYVRDAAEYDTGVITYTVNEAYAAAVTGYTPVAYFELHDGRDTLVATTERFSVTIEQCAYDGLEPAESWDSEIAQLIIDGTLAVNAVEDALETLVDQEQSMLTGATATVDSTTGTPSVTVTMGEPQEGGRSANFAFTGIKGETGATGAQGEKGDKGDKGDDYVITAADYAAIAQQVESDIQPTIDAAQDATSDATAAAAEARAASAATWLSGNVLFGELAEGTVLTADDTYAAPPKGVDVYGASTQNGTPTPSVPVPIKSVDDLTLVFAGKNLLDPSTCEQGKYYNSAGAVVGGSGWYASDYISAVARTAYVLSGNTATSASARYCFWDADKELLDTLNATVANAAFTTPDNTAYVTLSIKPSDINTCQFEAGTAPTTYVPYVAPTSVSIPLSDNSIRSLPDGTRDELHLAYLRPSTTAGWAWYSKTLVQRVDTEAITSFNAFSIDSDARQMFRIGSITRARANANNVNDRLFDKFGYQYSNWNYGTPGKASVGPGNGSFSFEPHTFASLADANAWAEANPIIAQFPLATPQTIDLGEVELPVMPSEHATVWADGGSAQPTMAMEYERDVNIALVMERDKAMAEIAPLETSPTKANHSVGTYLMYGGTLYKVTRAIASGEQITPGTNVTATTVAAELLALA